MADKKGRSESPKVSKKAMSADAGIWIGGLIQNVTEQTTTKSTAEKITTNLTGTKFESDEYNMSHARRGICLIINNTKFSPTVRKGDRVGSDIDADNLKKTFASLGFDVTLENKKTAAEMTNLMITYGSKTDHSDADCFVCILLSHGEQDGIYGTDAVVTFDQLFLPFRHDFSHSLNGKPKIFIVQACRDKEFSESTKPTDKTFKPGFHLPIEADMVVAYSTIPTQFSWRIAKDGSWFIQALCRMLKDFGEKKDLLWILTRVSRIVATEFETNNILPHLKSKKQIPCVVSMLTKEVHLKRK